MRKQIEEELHSKERSKTDLALIEEALRYGNTFNGMLAFGFSSSPFFFFWLGDSPGGNLVSLVQCFGGLQRMRPSLAGS